jgi:hypothetical protein
METSWFVEEKMILELSPRLLAMKLYFVMLLAHLVANLFDYFIYQVIPITEEMMGVVDVDLKKI